MTDGDLVARVIALTLEEWCSCYACDDTGWLECEEECEDGCAHCDGEGGWDCECVRPDIDDASRTPGTCAGPACR